MFIQSTDEMFTKCFSVPPYNHKLLGIQRITAIGTEGKLVNVWLQRLQSSSQLPDPHFKCQDESCLCLHTECDIQQWPYSTATGCMTLLLTL